MNIWNKVFLGVIFIAVIAVFVLVAVEFQIRNTGQKKVADLEKRITEANDKYARIVGGTDPGKLSPDKPLSGLGVDELRGQLRGRYDERGRAWFGCRVAGMEERHLPPALQQVEARIIITGPFAPSDTGAATDDVVMPEALKGVVYVFEEKEGAGEDAGAFLGRFSVSSEPIATKFQDNNGNEKNGWRIALITIDPINEGEIETISAAAESRWAVYLTPPVNRIADQRRPMPELEQEDKEGVDSRVVEIWKKYRETMDDPEAELAQDFSVLLDWLYQQRSTLNRDIRIVESDIDTYKTAKEKNDLENEKLEADCVLEEKRVEAMNVQRDAVKTLLEQYKTEINRIELRMEKLQTLITAYVAEMTSAQLLAVEKIEGRTKNTGGAEGE